MGTQSSEDLQVRFIIDGSLYSPQPRHRRTERVRVATRRVAAQHHEILERLKDA